MKHIKMKKADAEKWLAALRSGQYAQAKSKMFDGQGYCCLGVLQMELGEEIVKQEPMELPSYSWLVSKGITFYNAEGYTTYSPNIGDSHNNSASSLNDCGVSFHELADLLEREIDYTDIQEGEVA